MKKKVDTGFAELLLRVLIEERRVGHTLPPKKGLNATAICERWNKKFPHDGKKTPQVRAAINYLRTDKGELIGSTVGKDPGYSYCYTLEEYVEMNKHILTRCAKMWKAYNNPIKKKEAEAARRLSPELFATPEQTLSREEHIELEQAALALPDDA